MDNIQDIVNNIPVIVTLLTALVVGLIAIYGIFDKRMKDKNNEADTLDEKIRALYREETDAQGKKIEELTSKVANLEEAMKKMITENKMMKDILQGRDSQTLEFQKQGFEAIKTSVEIKNLLIEQKTLSLQNKDGILSVNKNVERLAKAIEKHLVGLEKLDSTR